MGLFAKQPSKELDLYEVRRIMANLESAEGTTNVSWSKGEMVRVINGPFGDFTGKIEEIDSGKASLQVLIHVFGQDILVELAYKQVEKL